MFIDNADSLIRIALSAPILYVTIVGFIRISGKRCTSQLNNFDWSVTVAMGSLVASGIVLQDAPILETMMAIGLLLAFQFAVTKAVINSQPMRSIINAEPRLLVRNGIYMRASRRYRWFAVPLVRPA